MTRETLIGISWDRYAEALLLKFWSLEGIPQGYSLDEFCALWGVRTPNYSSNCK